MGYYLAHIYLMLFLIFRMDPCANWGGAYTALFRALNIFTLDVESPGSQSDHLLVSDSALCARTRCMLPPWRAHRLFHLLEDLSPINVGDQLWVLFGVSSGANMSLILVLNDRAFQDTPFVEFRLHILLFACFVVLTRALSLRIVPSASLGGILLLRDLHILLFRHLHGFVHDLNIFRLLDRLEILLVRTLTPRDL